MFDQSGLRARKVRQAASLRPVPSRPQDWISGHTVGFVDVRGLGGCGLSFGKTK